jgi:hypothetical protein
VRAGTAVSTATVALVASGALRRLLEVRETRRGDLAPLGPTTRTVAGRQGPLAAAVDDWHPAPPRTRLGRFAAAAWAAPMTTTGALLAAAGGGRPTWDPRRGCWVATGVRGPSGVLLRALGLTANAIGQVVVVRTARPSAALLDHEVVHVRQFERLGPLLPALYAWFSARYGYRENPLERGARAGAAHRAG